MACAPVCHVCPKVRFTEAVTFTDGNLILNIPQEFYNNGQKVCILVTKKLPPETTITAPVYVTIGEGTELYPLTNCNCSQVTACAIKPRRKYSTCLVTNPNGGTFRLLTNLTCYNENNLLGVDGTTPTTPAPTPAPATPTGK